MRRRETSSGAGKGRILRSRRAVADVLGTLEAITREYLRERQKQLSPRSYSLEELMVKVKLLPFFGSDTKLSAIRDSDVKRYLESRGKLVGAASIRKELATLKKLFEWAIERNLISTNPARHFTSPQSSDAKRRCIEPHELNAIVAVCPEWLQQVVQFALATGMTRGEILGLRWKDVDVDAGTIAVHSSIKSRNRIVPMNSLARRVVSSLVQQGNKPSDHVFIGAALTPLNLSQNFLRACRRAGVPDAKFSDIRYTVASWMALHGTSIGTLAAFLGHANVSSTASYMKKNMEDPGIKDLEKLVEKLAYSSAPTTSAPPNARFSDINHPSASRMAPLWANVESLFFLDHTDPSTTAGYMENLVKDPGGRDLEKLVGISAPTTSAPPSRRSKSKRM